MIVFTSGSGKWFVTITSEERVEYSHGDNWLVTRQVIFVTDKTCLVYSSPLQHYSTTAYLPAFGKIFALQNEDIKAVHPSTWSQFNPEK